MVTPPSGRFSLIDIRRIIIMFYYNDNNIICIYCIFSINVIVTFCLRDLDDTAIVIIH